MHHTDHIFIDGLRVPVRIGTSPDERSQEQVLAVFIRLYLPLAQAGRADALSGTVDYAVVSAAIAECARTRTFKLVEAFAEAVADIGLAYPTVQAVQVRIEKRVLAATDSVGVSIWRDRR